VLVKDQDEKLNRLVALLHDLLSAPVRGSSSSSSSSSEPLNLVLIFTETKVEADRLEKILNNYGRNSSSRGRFVGMSDFDM
jgi:superfamily II DNA/RNA helicase